MSKKQKKNASKKSANSRQKISEYDCVCIGTSMIIALEACHQSRMGKTVLMVDKDETFGGAWKTISIDGIDDVENAIHYFLPDEKGVEFMREDLKFSIEPSRGKYRYFRFLNLGYFKFCYSSFAGRLLYRCLYLPSKKTPLRYIYQLFKSVALAYNERGTRSYYTKSGSRPMLNNVMDRLDNHGVDIWYKAELTNVYFDRDSNLVHCEAGGKKIIAKCLVLGHGARIPRLYSHNGLFKLEEKYHPRPAFHLVVNDQQETEVFEAILTADTLIKYVHNVTRFSSLRNSNESGKKVFVFGLHPNVKDQPKLKFELFNKLKDLRLINDNASLIRAVYSHFMLPTIDDEDLCELKQEFGDLINVLKTENFAKGIGYYADRWRSSI